MKLPSKFKQTIKDIFYDKEISFYSANETKGSLGSKTVEKGLFLEKIMGNFQFQSREVIQELFGKTIEANGLVTCLETQADMNDFVVYLDTDYQITGILSFDSHIKIAVKNV